MSFWKQIRYTIDFIARPIAKFVAWGGGWGRLQPNCASTTWEKNSTSCWTGILCPTPLKFLVTLFPLPRIRILVYRPENEKEWISELGSIDANLMTKHFLCLGIWKPFYELSYWRSLGCTRLTFTKQIYNNKSWWHRHIHAQATKRLNYVRWHCL